MKFVFNLFQQTLRFGHPIRLKMSLAKGTDLTKVPAVDVKKWLDSFDTVLTDCDGVLWVFNKAINGSPDVINKFKDLGKKVYFITNNSTKTRSEFLVKALDLNFKMVEDEIISTAYVAAQYLKKLNFNKTVYVIGTTGIGRELDAVGIKHIGIGPDTLNVPLHEYVNSKFVADPDVAAVIVGFDDHFSFPKMFQAATYLERPGCLFIATNTDERFPMPNYVIPGTGSFVRSIETAAERPATIMGKPNPYVCESLLSQDNFNAARTLMIGDRGNTDIALGSNCGFQTLLVGTGIHSLADVELWKKSTDAEERKNIPDVYLPSLGDLLQYMN